MTPQIFPAIADRSSRRGKRNTNPGTRYDDDDPIYCHVWSTTDPASSLIQIEGVKDPKAATFYLGKKVAFVYRAQKEIRGSKIRVIWGKITRSHGRSACPIPEQFTTKIIRGVGQNHVVSIITVAERLDWFPLHFLEAVSEIIVLLVRSKVDLGKGPWDRSGTSVQRPGRPREYSAPGRILFACTIACRDRARHLARLGIRPCGANALEIILTVSKCDISSFSSHPSSSSHHPYCDLTCSVVRCGQASDIRFFFVSGIHSQVLLVAFALIQIARRYSAFTATAVKKSSYKLVQTSAPLIMPAKARPKSMLSFTHRKSSSSSQVKVDNLIETPQEKASHRVTSKADPTKAINEAQPDVQAREQSTLDNIRLLQHRDRYGNLITDPDRSNPTRPRLERPLDTIRAFEAAIDGSYERATPSRADTSDGMNGQSRRTSYYLGQRPQHRLGSETPAGYGNRMSMGRPDSTYIDNNGSNLNQPGYGRRVNNNRANSDPILYGTNSQTVYPTHGYHQSHDTVASASGNESHNTDPWGNSTDPSSENSSIDRIQHAPKPDPAEAYGFNGFGGAPQFQGPIMEEHGVDDPAYGERECHAPDTTTSRQFEAQSAETTNKARELADLRRTFNFWSFGKTQELAKAKV
ncbi:MAG: hypothetical protein L6R40_001291 [Gallowayella cf. fulva]|nr:MAG: hypothetical protein L6R40_001291 [Xanthomendoza cf. fulva]